MHNIAIPAPLYFQSSRCSSNSIVIIIIIVIINALAGYVSCRRCSISLNFVGWYPSPQDTSNWWSKRPKVKVTLGMDIQGLWGCLGDVHSADAGLMLTVQLKFDY